MEYLLETSSQFKLLSVEMKMEPSSQALLVTLRLVKLKQPSWLLLWLLLEGDYAIVIYSLKDPNYVLDWKLDNLISLVFSLFLSTSLWEVRKVNRNANFCAYYVAYWATARIISGNDGRRGGPV
jgi:hypothetical protein